MMEMPLSYKVQMLLLTTTILLVFFPPRNLINVLMMNVRINISV